MDEMTSPAMTMEEKVAWEETPIKVNKAFNKTEEDAKKGIDRNLRQHCASYEAEEDDKIKKETRAKEIYTNLRKFYSSEKVEEDANKDLTPRDVNK